MTKQYFTVSRVSGAPVTSAALIADLRRVAQELSQPTVTQRQYQEHGIYAPTTQASRFGSWNRALVEAGLGTDERSLSDDVLLADLRRVSAAIAPQTVSIQRYRELGEHDVGTFKARFRSWNAALSAARLDHSKHVGIPDERLYENILRVWEHYGRQPRRRELNLSPSTISQGPYWRRFGSWTVALERFAEFMNEGETGIDTFLPKADKADPVDDRAWPLAAEKSDETSAAPAPSPTRPRGSRDPSLRLRWRVLNRDQFRCRNCGASPATGGPDLHVDHIVAWSLGGDTVLENLQTLCVSCNLGKSNLPLTDSRVNGRRHE